jgi:hypothetical protein
LVFLTRITFPQAQGRLPETKGLSLILTFEKSTEGPKTSFSWLICSSVTMIRSLLNYRYSLKQSTRRRRAQKRVKQQVL